MDGELLMEEGRGTGRDGGRGGFGSKIGELGRKRRRGRKELKENRGKENRYLKKREN